MNLTAEAVIMLIARYGIPLAQSIYNRIHAAISASGAVTPEAWDELLALESYEARKARVKAELDAAGIPTPGPSPG